jgi:Mrp family chromosome partitioning ATPase/capsular polysaccharide biosynthesis protein
MHPAPAGPEPLALTTAMIETDAVTLHDYLRVLRRRKWIVVQAAIMLTLAAVAFSLHQQRRYEASADVLLSADSVSAPVPGTPLSGLSQDPERTTQTQAQVARVPEVVQGALDRVSGTGLSIADFLANSSVSTSPTSDILTFAVTNPDPTLTKQLANAYAQSYSDYRQRLYSESIDRAIADVDQRIQRLDRTGASLKNSRADAGLGALTAYGALYSSLVDRQETLQSMQALQSSVASVLRQADGASLTQPKTARNGALGLVVGLVLGLGLAFLREALETRVRTTEEVSARLGGLPLLGRLPRPPKRLRRSDKLVMLEDPASAQAEAFRMLRANLDFVTLERDARTVIITSALEQEGKSTTVANLAVAFARAGKRVVLVDLDLRRPVLARFFDLEGPGITQVALGHVPLEAALAGIGITDPPAPRRRLSLRRSGDQSGNVTRELLGRLEVLPSGPIPPDPGEFVSTAALGKVMAALRERTDVVLIDAPAALHVGDVVSLSSLADGILVVARPTALRRQTLAELKRLLSLVRTPALGLVATGENDGESYAVGSGSGAHRSRAFETAEASGR